MEGELTRLCLLGGAAPTIAGEKADDSKQKGDRSDSDDPADPADVDEVDRAPAAAAVAAATAAATPLLE